MDNVVALIVGWVVLGLLFAGYMALTRYLRRLRLEELRRKHPDLPADVARRVLREQDRRRSRRRQRSRGTR